MEPTDALRWSDLVRDLIGPSNKTQFAMRMGFSVKEVTRWLRGEVKPQGRRAEKLMEECERSGSNWRKYRGLKPVYDFHSSFEKNVQYGPQGLTPPVQHLPKLPCRLWDHNVDSPLGIPASVLTLNSKWVAPLLGLGWDIITAKTVRTRPASTHPMPNWVYVPEVREPLSTGSPWSPVRATTDAPEISIDELSGANSFGMPSTRPDEWQEDLRATKGLLGRGQILIASVVGTADDTRSDVLKSLVNDFVECARLAAEVQPHAIELNFSCPNVYGREGSIFQNPKIAGQICKKIRSEIPDARILVKIGYLPPDELQPLFDATFKYVDGYTAINTLSAKVVTAGQREEQTFPGIDRTSGGLSGVAIKQHALASVKRLRTLALHKKPDLVIIGVGGISSAADVNFFIDAGANAVQICTAAVFNPLLAVEIRKQLARERTPMNHSRILEKAGLRVTFHDQHTVSVFEMSLRVAERMDVPFEFVYSLVQTKWLNSYVSELSRISESKGSPVRTRLSNPTESQIETWVRDELAKRP